VAIVLIRHTGGRAKHLATVMAALERHNHRTMRVHLIHAVAERRALLARHWRYARYDATQLDRNFSSTPGLM
jgi:hypothetical protein